MRLREPRKIFAGSIDSLFHGSKRTCHDEAPMSDFGRKADNRYDDGAFSGASLERPALQSLLTEVRSGKIDIVVVYKVDRLTRSLADFAKLVELFEQHSVSFVSVTHRNGRSVRARRLIRPAPVDVSTGQRGTATSCLS
jgi:Resolvase, N terminal domain